MWVIGNGESRRTVNIDKLDDKKVGCNAILRDYHVDHLVCVDRRMVEEALNKGINTQGTIIYTRPDWFPRYKTLKLREVPKLPYNGTERWDEPFHWGSGPYAVLLGARLDKQVDMIGFDLYSQTEKINNIYKDTENYDPSSKRPVDPRYWIHQIGKVFECFPKVQFKIYQTEGWELPKVWIWPNVTVDKISNIM